MIITTSTQKKRNSSENQIPKKWNQKACQWWLNTKMTAKEKKQRTRIRKKIEILRKHYFIHNLCVSCVCVCMVINDFIFFHFICITSLITRPNDDDDDNSQQQQQPSPSPPKKKSSFIEQESRIKKERERKKKEKIV